MWSWSLYALHHCQELGVAPFLSAKYRSSMVMCASNAYFEACDSVLLVLSTMHLIFSSSTWTFQTFSAWILNVRSSFSVWGLPWIWCTLWTILDSCSFRNCIMCCRDGYSPEIQWFSSVSRNIFCWALHFSLTMRVFSFFNIIADDSWIAYFVICHIWKIMCDISRKQIFPLLGAPWRHVPLLD